MYRYERTHADPIIGSRSANRWRQATLIDHLRLPLCCVCVLFPGGALVLSSRHVTLLATIHPLVDVLHVPLTVMIFLLHPVILVVDSRRRPRVARPDRRDAAVGPEGGDRRRLALFPGAPLPRWRRIKDVCGFGASYFATAWCVLITLALIGCIRLHRKYLCRGKGSSRIAWRVASRGFFSGVGDPAPGAAEELVDQEIEAVKHRGAAA